ncbi:MAG: hypothetical protein QE570_01505 [Verrucomicrobiota bacterium]|jgi:hypothetical protein|nr:hypothetical protein [Verrucomicrobiota bacterium]
MQFIHDGIFHKVARITGPAHNLLSLRFAVGDDQTTPVVERLKPVLDASLDSQSVLSEAKAGVNDANQRFGTSYRIASLQFADDDTPPESVYRMLAFSLVERLVTGLPFVEMPAKP